MTDTVLHFNGSCKQSAKRVFPSSIVHIMNGKGKFARLKTQCGMISVGARVCFKRAVSALEEIRQHAHIVAGAMRFIAKQLAINNCF